MMHFHTILTHPGGAHKDDFLACCLMLSQQPVPVLRREPTPEDLADPGICVIDVGGEHVPERLNFDHHQFHRNLAPTCSLSLVLQHLGLYEDARAFCTWLEPAEWFDARGPKQTAEWLGVDRDIIHRLNSPIDITMLRRFALASSLEAGDPLWEIMRFIGEDLVDYLRSMRDRLDFIEEHSEFWELESEGECFRALFLPRTNPLPDDPSMGLGQFIYSKGMESKIAALVYPDRRGPGYGLTRFQDNPRLDFTRITDYADVHFTHAGGFVAKVSATEPDRLRELAAAAWA